MTRAGTLQVIFDLGGVLIDWNPRYLYRQLFAGDEAGMERFLAEICSPEWNHALDAGRPYAQGVAELVRRHPQERERIEAYRERWLEMVAGPIAPTVALLERLDEAGVPLWALTNWSAETFALVRPDPAYAFLDRFRRIFVSGELRPGQAGRGDLPPRAGGDRRTRRAMPVHRRCRAQRRRGRRLGDAYPPLHRRPGAGPRAGGPRPAAGPLAAGPDAPLDGPHRPRPGPAPRARGRCRLARPGRVAAALRRHDRHGRPGAARARSCATPTPSRTSRRRARPTPTRPWATCTARTACGRWSSTGWPARAGWRRCWARRRCRSTATCARWAWPRAPRPTSRAQSPADLALLEAYARGVNAAIAGYGIALPPEFLLLRHRPEPWRPVDCLRLQKLLALTLSGNWRQELLRARLAQRLRPDQLADLWPGEEPGGPITMAAALDGLPLDALAAALPPAPPAGLGSNVWVAAGSRTASGQPLLANDPHLPLQMPGQWYLAQIEAPGLSVIGATLPGLPFVVLGRNRELAWGFSTTGSDTQDLFIERVDPADPGRYLAPGGGEPFAVRREEIAVRGGAPVPLEIRGTRHGPVVSDLAAATAEVAGARPGPGPRLDPAAGATTPPLGRLRARPGARPGRVRGGGRALHRCRAEHGLRGSATAPSA